MDVTQSVSSHKSLWAGLILTESEVRGLGGACLLPTDTGCQRHRAQTTGQTRGEKQKGKLREDRLVRTLNVGRGWTEKWSWYALFK